VSALGPNGDCAQCGKRHVPTTGGNPCAGHISTGPKDGPLKQRAGGPCTNPAMTGQAVCHAHGGRNPKAKAAAAKREAEAKIVATARKLIPDVADREPIRNPLERLLELASEADAFRESLRRLANDVDEHIASGGNDAQLRAEVATYRQALKDTTDLLVAIAKLDIETVLARIESRKIDLVITALTVGLDEANLSNEQKRAVMTGVGRHLRSVRGSAA